MSKKPRKNTHFKLPNPKLHITSVGKNEKVNCLKRDVLIDYGAEEKVRQRVLYWLINKIKWPKEFIKVEKSHKWISDLERSRVRSDIELRNKNNKTELVIECKAPNKKLTDVVFEQARNYANKTGAKNIWLTNGEEHKFMVLDGKKWNITETLEIMNISAPTPQILPDFPKKLNENTINEYFTKRHIIGDPRFTKHPAGLKRIVAAFHKLFFYTKIRLPYSTDSGFHILQDYGPMEMSVGTGDPDTDGYSGWYRGFATGTTGRVAILRLGISHASRNAKGAQVCIVAQSSGEVRHILQLRLEGENCTINDSNKCWDISHDGKMSGIAMENVMTAVRESGLSHLIYKGNDKKQNDRIRLGQLKFPESNITWENSKYLINNLLLYGMIRYNLRIAITARKKAKKSKLGKK